MSLKKNILANYISQIYVTAIGILMLPLYIKYMGAEAYGLVGFFTMLQAWFNLLDLGLTPTVGRETARYRAGAMSSLDFRRLFRSLHCIFFKIATVGGVLLFYLSPYIVTNWLKLENIRPDVAVNVIKIMAFCVSIRWMCGLYRGLIAGSENLVWLSLFSVVFATLRFIVVFPVMWFFGFEPLVFFVYQLFIAVLEVLGLYFKSNTMLPMISNLKVGWSFYPVRKVLPFSLTIAFTSSIWVMVTQTDKLILSKILPLAIYGYFALAVLIAGGVMMTMSPISNAIMPRMARLHAENDYVGVLNLYRSATQLTAVITGSAALTLAFFAKPLLWAWTGDVQIVDSAAPTLRLYALGNGLLAISAFPYYLQYARGNLHFHFIGNILLLFVMVPTIYVASTSYGMVGAGYSWFSVNTIFLLLWVWFVHYKLEPNFHLKWLFKDVLTIWGGALIVGFLINNFGFESESRLLSFVFVMLSGAMILAVSIVCSSIARAKISWWFARGKLL